MPSEKQTKYINEFNRSRGSCVSENCSVLWDYKPHVVTEHLHTFINVSAITITSSVLLCVVVLQVTDVFKECYHLHGRSTGSSFLRNFRITIQ